MSSFGRGALTIGALLSFGILATWLIEKMGLDLICSRYFYSLGHDEGLSSGWVVGALQPWSTLYRYGEAPGIVLCGVALVALVSSWLGFALEKWRRPCLVIIFSVAIGPGLLVNAILKPYCGRPRPADLVEFGGAMHYQDVWARSSCCTGKSFPCGHCAIGFSLSSVVALTPYHRLTGLVGLMFGLVYGLLLSVTRLLQGGHFLTDILWSFVIVYVVIAALYYFVFPIKEGQK